MDVTWVPQPGVQVPPIMQVLHRVGSTTALRSFIQDGDQRELGRFTNYDAQETSKKE